MTQLFVRVAAATSVETCPLCGQEEAVPATQLVLAATQQPVCQSCGRKHAPELAALADLADEAQRIGRIARHTVAPPYTALLSLAQAAYNFTARTGPTRASG
ncbi:MAG: hypothetical protein U0840_02545 [Gemmataceae bacterium]